MTSDFGDWMLERIETAIILAVFGLIITTIAGTSLAPEPGDSFYEPFALITEMPALLQVVALIIATLSLYLIIHSYFVGSSR